MLNEAATLSKSAAWRMFSSLTSPQVAHRIGEPFFRLMGLRKKSQKINLSQVKRALVVRLDEIGDVVMTTPFVRELRRNLPDDAWMALVVKPQLFNLVELCPYVNEVFTYDHGEPSRLLWRLVALRLAFRNLWRRRFDLAIVPRCGGGYYHGTFIGYLSGATWRVGYSEKVNDRKPMLNSGFEGLVTHVLDDNTVKHEVEHNLDVIRFLGGTVQDERLESWVGEEDKAFAEEILKSHGLQADELLVAFGPGAGAPKRMWPLANFVELGNWLERECHARIVVVGGGGEEPLGQELRRQLSGVVIDTVGQTTLRQTSALLKRCRLYVGSDAGPMHLAAASGIPVVEISCHPSDGLMSHDNSPHRFGPWGVARMVLQPEKALAPCCGACAAVEAHCILGVSVKQVEKAVLSLVNWQIVPFARDRVSETSGSCF